MHRDPRRLGVHPIRPVHPMDGAAGNDTLGGECHSVPSPIVISTSCIPTTVKRPTERELLLEALDADAAGDLPPALAERLDAIVGEVEPAQRVEAIQALFEELAQ